MLNRYTPIMKLAGSAPHNQTPLCLKTKPVCFEIEFNITCFGASWEEFRAWVDQVQLQSDK